MPQRAKVSRCWAFQQQDRFRLAETKRMRFAIEKAGIEQPFDVTGRHRTVGDALAARGNFDHRLEPEQAARAGANDFGVDLATAERRNNRPIDERVQAPLIEPAEDLAVQHSRLRAGAEVKAEHRLERQPLVGGGFMPIDTKLFTRLHGKRIRAHRLTGLGATEFEDMLARWR